eukprot:PhF_6_TR43154/c1_g1_i1/m.66066
MSSPNSLKCTPNVCYAITGPFVIMLGKMLRKDVMCFALIYSAFLFGCSQALYSLNHDQLSLNAFGTDFRRTFFILLGDFEYDKHVEAMEEGTRHEVLRFLRSTLLGVYMVMVVIVLLNVLVAMMSSTYASVSCEADKVWRLEYTRLLFSIENEVLLVRDMNPWRRHLKDSRRKQPYWEFKDGKYYMSYMDMTKR